FAIGRTRSMVVTWHIAGVLHLKCFDRATDIHSPRRFYGITYSYIADGDSGDIVIRFFFNWYHTRQIKLVHCNFFKIERLIVRMTELQGNGTPPAQPSM